MNKAWKDVERRAAAFFGTKRVPGSGSMSAGRPDQTNSDSVHERLYIEAKRRKGFMAMLKVAKSIAKLAHKEKKLPVLWFQYGGEAWMCVRPKDWDEIAEWRLMELDRERAENEYQR